MVEKAVALDILENIENDLKCGNKDKAIENIDKILNNKLYYLMAEYKKSKENWTKNKQRNEQNSFIKRLFHFFVVIIGYGH